MKKQIPSIQLRFASKVDQIVEVLREDIERGKWRKELPGRAVLSNEMGVDPKTVERALKKLEREGIVASQGRGRKRLITLKNTAKKNLNITFLIYEESDRVQLFHDELIHRINLAGHTASIAPKTMHDLGMNLNRISAYVKTIDTDAWVVSCGPRDVLEWIATQPIAVFSEFGRNGGIPMPSLKINKSPAILTAVRKLVAMGHKRIVMLAREERRKPTLGQIEREFLKELNEHGIVTGSYNLPDWENSISDYHRCLDSLFNTTPPTALFISEPPHFMATLLYLSRRGLRVPQDVSLICHDPDPSFSWCEPMATHISWDIGTVTPHVLDWANHVAAGKPHLKQSLVETELIGEGTIGPAPN